MTVPTARLSSGFLQHIYDEGFDIDLSHNEEVEPCAVCISMPKSVFTDSNL